MGFAHGGGDALALFLLGSPSNNRVVPDCWIVGEEFCVGVAGRSPLQ